MKSQYMFCHKSTIFCYDIQLQYHHSLCEAHHYICQAHYLPHGPRPAVLKGTTKSFPTVYVDVRKILPPSPVLFFPLHLRQRRLAFRAHISDSFYAELIIVVRWLVPSSKRTVIYAVLVDSGFSVPCTGKREGHLQVWWYQRPYNTILTSWRWAHGARNM